MLEKSTHGKQASSRQETVGVAVASSEPPIDVVATSPSSDYRVIRRNNKQTVFDRTKIEVAMTKAFLAVESGVASSSTRIHEEVMTLTDQVYNNLTRRAMPGAVFHIEEIQDQVELALMRSGHHKVARAYVIYREERARERRELEKTEKPREETLAITGDDGQRLAFDEARFVATIEEACEGLAEVSVEQIAKEARRNVFDGIAERDLNAVLVMAARTLIETEHNYTFVAARLLMDHIRREALSLVAGERVHVSGERMAEIYPQYFPEFIRFACERELLDKRLTDEYDLEKISAALLAERDLNLTYLSLQTLYDRYFIHSDDTRIELPQAFFMRVAMGLALHENPAEREDRAIEFYRRLSSFDFMSSTPTLFNSATLRPQLSSCYLTTVADDLDGIFESIKENALLSKYSGGLGNDWTQVRSMGAYIKGTNGKSQGVVPFLKVANDTAVAVNQGGKRKGAVCAYLETWHRDVEEFLELRKNTGDDRRRTHDMNTANWVPDLFMERLHEDAEWTLFSPHEVPDLHDLHGKAFKERYLAYEELAEAGELKTAKRVKAQVLWRKMLGMLYETGHPWITFKDACNIRSPQRHVGVVHSSNLCTEITLNTSKEEIAVCNLGSINLHAHIDENGLRMDKLEKTITTAIRMLDNVIEYNYYTVDKARNSNLRHRPIGLGVMGFQDALYALRLPYAGEEAVEFADRSMEAVSYFAIKASCELAKERGRYPSFEGSLWSQGILPIDSLKLLAEERGGADFDLSSTLDWDGLREDVKKHGMRNSNVLAIAPTATISNICGVAQSIEPMYQNLFVKSNLSGEFTVANPHLAKDLKKLGMWDDVMINDLKYYDGRISQISRIPPELRELYATAFEIDPKWLVKAGARRQKWIDQSQSLNLYMGEPSGAKMDELYKLAWSAGLKTTYYLRTLGATHTEKSTSEAGQLNAVDATVCPTTPGEAPDPDCEACQ